VPDLRLHDVGRAAQERAFAHHDRHLGSRLGIEGGSLPFHVEPDALLDDLGSDSRVGADDGRGVLRRLQQAPDILRLEAADAGRRRLQTGVEREPVGDHGLPVDLPPVVLLRAGCQRGQSVGGVLIGAVQPTKGRGRRPS